MARYLLAATALPGHVQPLLAVARHLRAAGHQVCFHTASAFRAQVERTGAVFEPFEADIDHDHHALEQKFPQQRLLPAGHARLCFGLRHFFADAIAPQCQGLRRILQRFAADAILTDTMFCGTFPLLLGPRQERPPIVALGITALALSSVDAAAFGLGMPPPTTPQARQQNRALQATLQRTAFGEVQRHFDTVLQQLGRPPLPAFFADAMVTLPDLYLQLTAQAFEYPRSDLPASVRFVGPLLAPPVQHFTPPPWWSALDDGRTVVLVTQGTLANGDPHQLIVPTLKALADQAHLHVIATTGGPITPKLAAMAPANARIVDFVPYSELLPKVQLMVTNGGYGSVNHALSLGIPMVVAGDTEEKPEIAARVAWSGAGINLRTGRPSSRALADAVRLLQADPAYRQRAMGLGATLRRHDALTEITQALQSLHTLQASQAPQAVASMA